MFRDDAGIRGDDVYGFYAARTMEMASKFPRHVLNEVPEDVIGSANDITQLRFELASEDAIQFHDNVDWTFDPTADSRKRWSRELHRHRWIATLGEAYRATSDARYANCFIQLLTDWIEKNPPPSKKDESNPVWTLMGVGMRSMVWPIAFELFFDAEEFTPAFAELMLKSIHAHGEFLCRFTTRYNHLLREANGLLHLAVRFPEFLSSEVWYQTAVDRLTAEMRQQLNPDGSHIELSPAYQWLVVEEFSSTLSIVSEADEAIVDSEFRELLRATLRKAFEYLALISRPDGSWGQINDGFMPDSIYLRAELHRAAELLGGDGLEYVSTRGSQGRAPQTRSFLGRYSGLAIFRDGWSPDANFLSFNTGQFGGDHGHEDCLSVEVFCNQVLMLADPGSYTYVAGSPYRTWFAGSNAHNTVTVNRMSQARRWQSNHKTIRKHEPVSTQWEQGEGFCYAAATYNDGYQRFRFDRPGRGWIRRDISHQRIVLFVCGRFWVLVDRLRGNLPRRYERIFQCAPEIDLSVSQSNQDRRAQLRHETGVGMDILLPSDDASDFQTLQGSTNPIGGWVSNGKRNSKQSAPQLVVRSKRSRRADLISLLCPTSADNWGSVPTGLSCLETTSGEGVALQIDYDDADHGFSETLLLGADLQPIAASAYAATGGLGGQRVYRDGRIEPLFERSVPGR